MDAKIERLRNICFEKQMFVSNVCVIVGLFNPINDNDG